MSVMTLSGLQKTGLFVSQDMFGANAVFSLTDDGVPTAEYEAAADALGVQNIRFGGGQADLDPDKPNDAGDLPIDGVSSINIVEMDGGALRPELVNFLEWCAATEGTNQPVKTTLIIPTKHLTSEEYVAFADEIEVFVTKVMAEYGDVIAAFQIGNEHWEMGETAYGIKASIGAEAIEKGMLAAGVSIDNQPDILVQMATAGNEGSEFPAVSGVSDFVARNKAANEQVIAQLSNAAREAIDGVTEHYYYNKTDFAFPDTDAAVKNIDKDFRVWSDAFDKDLDLHITEWNVKTSATTQQGMVAASSLIKQFENMIEIGADGAHIWAIDYHSRTALTLDTDNGARLDDQGRLTNSVQGAAFDLMADALAGKELISTSFANGIPEIEVSAYASAEEVVFYISSRTLDQTRFTLDLARKLPAVGPVQAVQMAMDPASSNGKQWEQGVDADSVLIEGQPYFYNEHDIDVILTDLVFEDASQIELTLNPFEVVELTVDLKPKDVQENLKEIDEPKPAESPKEEMTVENQYVLGTDEDDLIDLMPNLVYIDSGAGLDTVFVDALSTEATVKVDGYGKPVMITEGLPNEVTLANVERVEFLDGTLAFDTEGNSGQAYRLYQASFDRTPDAAGLEFWVKQLDCGAFSLKEVASHFLKSAEFESAYGKNEKLSDTQFVDLLYQNVLDRQPDPEGYAFWCEQQENNLSREQMLVSFSESVENKSNVSSAIDDGIWYT
ncbi:DUF4214 domain-containing protein [Sulfitobacter sp. JBTF-M27]|uniref:DUF4214 domain-containing protein n=1 Tax=Sulfitobacter sediminilitoris TaxID=2698830 RepID=A0A6P0C757_9RHOB|nr:DUF4214 domain-containing protein [Sulfitobacter sediminilitoris]NEK21657.1 DUF4214 domain-containing protein [Sulfitobacter sediminilitoris]